MVKQQQHRQLTGSRLRYLRLAMLMLLALSALAACGSPAGSPAGDQAGQAATSEPAATAPAAAGEPVTVRWLIWADDIANDTNLNDEIKLFNESQSEIKVELIGVPWNDFTPKLQALVAAGTPPDIVAIQNEAAFVSKGFMLPLEEFIERDQLDKSRFLPGSLEPAYDGKIYGFRHDTAYWLLYYNKDLFDQAGMAYPPETGWTLDEFMEAACALSKPDDLQWGMHNIHWITGILIQQQGLPYLEMVDGVPQFKLDDPRTVALYQKLGDFINKRNCQPTADQSSSLGGADPFLAGRSAMQFNGNWGFGYMKENASFNWAVAPLPGLKQPNVGMKIGIVSSSPNQEAAWRFLKWLTYEPEATRFRAERGMGQPAINDEQAIQTFLNGPSAPEGLPAVFEVLSNPDNSFRMLDVPGLAEANNLINPVSDEIMNGLSQAADVLPPVVPKANEILAEEWRRSTGQ